MYTNFSAGVVDEIQQRLPTVEHKIYFTSSQTELYLDARLRGHDEDLVIPTHKRAGNSIAVWQAGKLIGLKPEDIPEPL
jgi:hypothetical protein